MVNRMRNEQVVHYSARDERARAFVNPVSLGRSLWKHRELLVQFTKRETFSRYKGSQLGVLWSFLQPLLMLAIYTFVFSVVFQAKWGVSQTSGPVDFALTMFCGMIPFTIFNESLNRAPMIIVSNPNYVKKVVFPLELLPVSIWEVRFCMRRSVSCC
jgi:lipopolysaccharide transport system permease protein